MLETRVGWATIIDPGFVFALDVDVQQTDSGRYFHYFHEFVTCTNILAIVQEPDYDAVEFNEYIRDLRRQAVYDALSLVIDKDPNYDPTADHDTYINDRVRLFDDVIGYCVAKKVLQLLLASVRSNRIQRLSADVLSYELSNAKGTVGSNLDDAVSAAVPPFDKHITIKNVNWG